MAAVRKLTSLQQTGPQTEIVVANRQGVVVGSLIDSKDFIRPIWSPDGRHIFAISYDLTHAFGRWDWSSGQKKVISVDGLAADCGLAKHKDSDSSRSGRPPIIQSISIAPSGNKIALLCDFRRIAIASLESKTAHTIQSLTPIFSYIGIPDWLDNDRLLVIARKADDQARLWEIDINTNSTRTISVSDLRLRDYVTVAPDRRSVVVTAMAAGEASWSLWRVDLDGTPPVRLTTGAEDVGATWVSGN